MTAVPGRSSLRILFMGTAEFAVPALLAVARRHRLLAVVTQPDRPRGRGRALAPPPVKLAARELGVEVLQPETLRSQPVRSRLMSYGPDAIVVAAYGQIIRPRLLSAPPLGCVNVHASLLPRLRGAAPIQWAVLRGEPRSGVTIMQMDAGVDTGPILLASQPVDLRADETAGSLHDRLAPLGGELLLQALQGLIDGTVQRTPQDDALATEAPMLSKEDGQVDFVRPAEQVDRWIRGMDPVPGAFTFLQREPAEGVEPGERLRLFGSAVASAGGGGRPGEVLADDDRGLLVACGEGAVWIRELQLPGRRRMAATALLAGRAIPVGTVLGTSSRGS